MDRKQLREGIRQEINALIDMYPTAFADLDALFPHEVDAEEIDLGEEIDLAVKWMHSQPADRVAVLILAFVAAVRALSVYRQP